MKETEIWLVEMVDGEDLLTMAKAFTSQSSADKCFENILSIVFRQEITEEIKKSGYYADDKHSSLIKKKIPLVEQE